MRCWVLSTISYSILQHPFLYLFRKILQLPQLCLCMKAVITEGFEGVG